MVKLQLALDFVDLKSALKVAKAAAPYVDWMEAGTPLIKSEGLKSVTRLRKLFPRKTIVADMKTMDVGALEVGMAANAGADVVTVCGAAPEETVKSAIKQGKKRKIKVTVDLINVPKAKWKKIDSMKPDYVLFHLGIDQQKNTNVVKALGNVNLKSKLIVAGGINAKTAPLLVKAGASVIIVGGAITKSKNPKKAAKEIKEAMLT